MFHIVYIFLLVIDLAMVLRFQFEKYQIRSWCAHPTYRTQVGTTSSSTVVGSSHHESDEELNDHLSVNLVVLDEVHNKPYGKRGYGRVR